MDPVVTTRDNEDETSPSPQRALLVGLASVAIGAILFVSGVVWIDHLYSWSYSWSDHLKSAGVATSATLTEINPNKDDSPHVCLGYIAGTVPEDPCVPVNSVAGLNVGHRVSILYDPQHPSDALVVGHVGDDISLLDWVPIVLGFVALVFGLVALVWTAVRRRRNRRKNRDGEPSLSELHPPTGRMQPLSIRPHLETITRPPYERRPAENVGPYLVAVALFCVAAWPLGKSYGPDQQERVVAVLRLLGLALIAAGVAFVVAGRRMRFRIDDEAVTVVWLRTYRVALTDAHFERGSQGGRSVDRVTLCAPCRKPVNVGTLTTASETGVPADCPEPETSSTPQTERLRRELAAEVTARL